MLRVSGFQVLTLFEVNMENHLPRYMEWGQRHPLG